MFCCLLYGRIPLPENRLIGKIVRDVDPVITFVWVIQAPRPSKATQL